MDHRDDFGRLTLTLRIGESAVVETTDGPIEVRCVRYNGANALSIKIIAPKGCPIDRKRER